MRLDVGFVMFNISQGVLFMLSFAVYAFLVGMLFPSLFLKPSFKGVKARDRGVKKYIFEGGRAIVCVPDVKSSKYIEQYILSSNNGEKLLKCKADPRVHSLKYDVVCFDAADKVIDALSIKDTVDRNGYTEAVSLDSETAYVNVIAKAVNGTKVSKVPTIRYSSISIMLYVALCSLFTLIEVMIVKVPVLYIIDNFTILRYTQRVGDSGDLSTALITLIVSVCCFSLVVLCNLSSNKAIRNDSPIAASVKRNAKKKKGVRYDGESATDI